MCIGGFVNGDDQHTFFTGFVIAPSHGTAGPGTQGISCPEAVTLMNMPQSQIMKIRLPHLLGGDGAVGGGDLGGIAVEHTHSIALRMIGREIRQQTGAVHGDEACTVNAAVQLRNIHGFQYRVGENMYIFRPCYRQPGTVRAYKVVVAWGDEYRDPDAAQNLLQHLQCVCCVGAVKQVAGEQHHIAVMRFTQVSHFLRDPGKLSAQLLCLFFLLSQQGRVQVPVGTV